MSYPDKWVMSDVTLQDSAVGELRRITRVSQSHVLCQPQLRRPVSFSLMWHCCSSRVIQRCLSDGILKRDFVFGILTRGFILLITEVDRSWRICWQECHPARLCSAMTLRADDVKSNQKVGGIIMPENISSRWCARFWNSAITLIEFALWGNHPAV